MKISQKLSAVLLILAILLSIVGCGFDPIVSVDDSTSISDKSTAFVSPIIDEGPETDKQTETVDAGPETAGESSETVDQTKTADESSVSDKQEETTSPSSRPSSVGAGTATPVDPASVGAYTGTAYVIVNNNQPNFSAAELTATGYEKYSELDRLGRCGVAIASCSKDTMPGSNETRGSISSIKPSGWIQAKYNGISGGYLWNRCHLIGWQLSAENANRKNLITGTRYMNIEGMLPFENIVADYIKETNHHVAYRVTPIFEGNNLVCSGVQIEAYSVEDNGEGICFNVYCYNVQPGITIDYATGKSSGPANDNTTQTKAPEQTEPTTQSPDRPGNTEMVWVSATGKKYHRKSSCSNMKDPLQISRSEAITRGYEPCKKCCR